jgi:anthranilate/para-aminobenzoate synthase component I
LNWLKLATMELKSVMEKLKSAQTSQHKVQNNQQKLAKNHHKCHGKKLKSTTTRVAYHHKVQGAMEKIHGGRIQQ